MALDSIRYVLHKETSSDGLAVVAYGARGYNAQGAENLESFVSASNLESLAIAFVVGTRESKEKVITTLGAPAEIHVEDQTIYRPLDLNEIATFYKQVQDIRARREGIPSLPIIPLDIKHSRQQKV